MVTISGASLDWHDVSSYFRPNALSSYVVAPDKRLISQKYDPLFDVAVLADCSQCPVHPQLKAEFAEYTRKHANTARQFGAKPALFMTWADKGMPEATSLLAEAYVQAGNEANALVIPAGLAFARAIAQRPELNLYFADGQHPSQLGTYLAACTTYAALFQRSPVGLSFTGGLDEATARFLQTAAWETVQDFFKP